MLLKLNYTFKTNTKNVTKKFNFRLSGQKINLTEQVKYLGLLISNALTWDNCQDSLINKLNRAIGFLAKIWQYTPKFLLKSIYNSIFNSHLISAYQIWGQKNNFEKLYQLSKLQDKALCIIHFLSPQSPLDHIYHNENVLKLRDFTLLQNTLLIKNYFDSQLPCPFNRYFNKTKMTYTDWTQCSTKNCVSVSKVNTICCGKESIKFNSTKTCIYLQNTLNIDFLEISRTKSSNHFIETHMDTLFILSSLFLLPSFSNFSQNTVCFNKKFILISCENIWWSWKASWLLLLVS